MTKDALMISTVLLIFATASSLTNNAKRRISHRNEVHSSLFMSDPIKETSTQMQATATSLVTDTLQKATSTARRRKKGRKWHSERPPAVDSTLLRFIGKQKESLDPWAQLDYASCIPSPLAEGEVSETFPYEPQNADSLIARDEQPASAQQRGTASQFVKQKCSSSSQNNLSWWGQYNSHRVETHLLSLDSSLDRAALAKAASRVQSQVLARTVRRRIRNFLKQRDQTWKSDLVSALTIGSVGEMIQYSGGHSFEDTVNVLLSHGITTKDIVDILQHSPGIVLMRPRGCSENGECLDETVDRIFKLLCVTLKLRKYDARKIVRDSPGLLTMRGSKSAQSVVSLMSRMGVSNNAVARDKDALTVLLARSPSALFRLLAFLSSDAIRMPVNLIGPLFRRPLCQELLDAVVPVPQQLIKSEANDGSWAALGSPEYSEDLDEDMDPWIVSALWCSQSQIRRDRINQVYRKMEKTAWTLRNEIGTADLGRVIAAYPSVLLLDAEEQILPSARFLMNKLGILEGDLPRVLQLYPAILGLPMKQMEGVALYLLSLGVAQEDLSSLFRSFPAILTLDIEEDMKPVVHFMRDIGVMNVGRFLTRIPSILGFSVEKNLLPKWLYLKTVSADARFDVTKFPAYFSYPLERVIKARYEYIRECKKYPTQIIGLDKVLSYGDYDFAVKILKEQDEGQAFLNFLEQRSKSLESKKPTSKMSKSRKAKTTQAMLPENKSP